MYIASGYLLCVYVFYLSFFSISPSFHIPTSYVDDLMTFCQDISNFSFNLKFVIVVLSILLLYFSFSYSSWHGCVRYISAFPRHINDSRYRIKTENERMSAILEKKGIWNFTFLKKRMIFHTTPFFWLVIVTAILSLLLPIMMTMMMKFILPSNRR